MSSVLIVPACYSLPKVDVIRLVDDFAADADLQPTWGAFKKWTCSSSVDGGIDAGQGGLDGGIDAGQAVSCQLTLGPGDTSDDTALGLGVTDALIASFSVAAPSGVEVATGTKSAMSDGATNALPPSIPVDLTAFSELRFNATLVDTTPGTASLPIGTGLSVELHCSYSSMNSPVSALLKVDEKIVDLVPGMTTFQPIALALSKFAGASQRQTCLANVDSIGFVVTPGNALAGALIAGTLQLDNIRFDNAPP